MVSAFKAHLKLQGYDSNRILIVFFDSMKSSAKTFLYKSFLLSFVLLNLGLFCRIFFTIIGDLNN